MAASLKLVQEGKDSMDRQKALEAALAVFAKLRTGETVLLISDMADRDLSQFPAL